MTVRSVGHAVDIIYKHIFTGVLDSVRYYTPIFKRSVDTGPLSDNGLYNVKRALFHFEEITVQSILTTQYTPSDDPTGVETINGVEYTGRPITSVIWETMNIEDISDPDKEVSINLTISHTTGFQSSLGEPNNRLYENNGVVQIVLGFPYSSARGRGEQSLVDSWIQAVKRPFMIDNASDESGTVWFRNVRVNEIGTGESNRYEAEVLIDFVYDEKI